MTLTIEGAQIMHRQSSIGVITSGAPSPTLDTNIAMGYVDEQFRKPGMKLQIRVRGGFTEGEIVPLPFVPHRYYRSKIQ
jgi:glycine cleavage system T protein (aminomethyltransferase)